MKNLAIIGGGPAGFMAAISAAENSTQENLKITVFEKDSPLKTLLCTGNGRCNITNNINNYRELASNYPRGEKFLYSVFSKFGVDETIDWFKKKGVRLYTQDDNRMFPVSDSAETVRTTLLEKARELKIIVKQEVVLKLEKNADNFDVITHENTYNFDKVIISTGGSTKDLNSNGYQLVNNLEINSTERKPSLVGLKIREHYLTKLSGVSISNACFTILLNNKKIGRHVGDFIITHKGISGPVIFKISATTAFSNYTEQNPLVLEVNFASDFDREDLEADLVQNLSLQKNISISNLLKTYVPKSLAVELLNFEAIDPEKRSGDITKIERNAILNFIFCLKLKAFSTFPEGEMVTAGGIELKGINSKTLASKSDENIFFCGEVLDIDGFTGGFNLQACWSTGYIAGLSAVSE